MQIIDVLTQMSRAMRDLGAMRWGVPSTTPRVMAELLRRERVANRLYRRACDAGAPQLIELLVEFGGRLLPRQGVLEVEAARLRGWFPWQETKAGWAIPADLAAAMASQVASERFFAVTLAARLDDDELLALSEELALPPLGSHSTRVGCAARAAVDAKSDAPEVRAAADVIDDHQCVASEDIETVTYVRGSRGLLYGIEFVDGEVLEVCPREVAELLGISFDPVTVAAATPGPTLKESRVRLPPFTVIGALISFATARAAEDALGEATFRAIAARRLDERRVATRARCSVEQTISVLESLGFRIEGNGEAIS